MDNGEVRGWLAQDDATRLEELWRLADAARRRCVGDAVHLRGLIEISNRCRRLCGYCGLRADNRRLERYAMTAREILDCARQAVRFGYGTVVLQSGEDAGLSGEWVADLVARTRSDEQTRGLAVTLSLGERSEADLALWKQAGADRYLLRFETSNRALFELIHPSLPGRGGDRVAILRHLRRLGYEVGSGVMIGIPGQTIDDLAADIALFAELELDMIGVGPYIAHPDTPMGACPERYPPAPPGRQAPASELMTYKMIALARLACPRANIPSTTALATLNLAEGRELGLMRGANVVMPNLTPTAYRSLYEIYPAKACLRETADQCHSCMKSRIESIGRTVAVGRGDSLSHCGRTQTPAGSI
ncbi:MAG: [FeFe] hydrogenase H-cluster radical SAM maturase HydE [Planctomycetota bacterium]|nr:[FeFe] hydrogenase H-cluster radical SAM maturase HydE [Planctomycetota bacterium]